MHIRSTFEQCEWPAHCSDANSIAAQQAVVCRHVRQASERPLGPVPALTLSIPDVLTVHHMPEEALESAAAALAASLGNQHVSSSCAAALQTLLPGAHFLR